MVIDPVTNFYLRSGGGDETSAAAALAQAYGGAAVRSVLFTSGMNAIWMAWFVVERRMLALGRNTVVVAEDSELFSGTTDLFIELQKSRRWVRFSTKPGARNSLSAVLKAHAASVGLVFFESCSNPCGYIADFAALSALDEQTVVMVDNTWLSPRFNPFHHRVDIVVDSCTKYVSGGACIGGAVTMRSALEDIHQELCNTQMATGTHVSPVNCALIRKGLGTLDARMHCVQQRTALALKVLTASPLISQVLHPSVEGHPNKAEWGKYCGGLLPGVVLFQVRGARVPLEHVRKCCETVGFVFATSFGDARDRVECHESGAGGVWIRLGIGYDTPVQIDEAIGRFAELLLLQSPSKGEAVIAAELSSASALQPAATGAANTPLPAMVIDSVTNCYLRCEGGDEKRAEAALVQAYGGSVLSVLFTSGLNAIWTAFYVMERTVPLERKVVVIGEELFTGTKLSLACFRQSLWFVTFSTKSGRTNSLSAVLKEHRADVGLVFFESCSNPCGFIADFDALSALDEQTVVMVDNTWLSPRFNPFHHRVDIVVDSCTKYVSGGACIGGAVTVRLELGDSSFYQELLYTRLMMGTHISPVNCVLIARGLGTLDARMHCVQQRTALALKVLTSAAASPLISQVMHPSVGLHPNNEEWRKYCGGLLPGVVRFQVRGVRGLRKQVVQKSCETVGFVYATSFGGARDRVECPEDGADGVWIRLGVGYDTPVPIDEAVIRFAELLHSAFDEQSSSSSEEGEQSDLSD